MLDLKNIIELLNTANSLGDVDLLIQLLHEMGYYRLSEKVESLKNLEELEEQIDGLYDIADIESPKELEKLVLQGMEVESIKSDNQETKANLKDLYLRAARSLI